MEGAGTRTFAPVALSTRHSVTGRWVAIVVIALVVAIAKPWAGSQSADPDATGGQPGGRPSDAEGSLLTPMPTPTVRIGSVEPAVSAFCLDPGGWRLASIELWRDQTIRVWRALEPAAAIGPDDPTIPVIVVVSEGLPELGWCAPVIENDLPSRSATVKAWRRMASGSVSIRLDRSRPTDADSSFGALYGPPATPAIGAARAIPPDSESAGADAGGSPNPLPAPTDSWVDGIYVFRYGTAEGFEVWFAVQVELRPRTGQGS